MGKNLYAGCLPAPTEPFPHTATGLRVPAVEWQRRALS